MTKLEPEAAEMMTTLLTIITEEFGDDVPDFFLVEDSAHVGKAVSQAARYLMEQGYDVPNEVLYLVARFVRASGGGR